MAEVDSSKPTSLSEQYFLKGKEPEPEMAAKPTEESEVAPTVSSPAEEVVEKAEETPIVDDIAAAASDVVAAASDVVAATSDSAVEESSETTEADNSAPTEESSDSAEPETAEAEEDATEIKIETAPADFRFPTTNQTRHCFTRYIEYHRCIAAKGDEAPECDKFAKYYRSLCPGEWVDRWNEQRENGTFPGPL